MHRPLGLLAYVSPHVQHEKESGAEPLLLLTSVAWDVAVTNASDAGVASALGIEASDSEAIRDLYAQYDTKPDLSRSEAYAGGGFHRGAATTHSTRHTL